MSLLAPLFLLGLAALAVPVVVHLTARDRRDVLPFPSLRFLSRLPYRQVRRQKIRDPLLFALRALAVVLLVLAFARPFFGGAGSAGDASEGGDVVLALDVSYSMAYEGTWERALDAVRETLDALDKRPDATRVTLLTFDEKARVLVPPTADHAAVRAALDGLQPGSAGTRLDGALRLANETFVDAEVDQGTDGPREVVLVSDLQARAWDRTRPVRLLPGVTLRTVDVSAAEAVDNVGIAGVDLRTVRDGDEEALELSVRLVNDGPARDAVLGLTVGAEAAAEATVSLPAGGTTTSLRVAAPEERTRATLRLAAEGDRLAPDSVFYLVLDRRPTVPVLLVEAESAPPSATLYLREALAISEDVAFDVRRRRRSEVRPADVEAASLVIVHDGPLPAVDLDGWVRAGGGLWVVLGGNSGDVGAPYLPGTWEAPVDRLGQGIEDRGVGLASVDFSHPIFEVFAGEDDGNVAAPRIYRYRPIVAGEGSAVLARTTDGAVALAERRHGAGRVLLWGSPLANRWSNLPVQPIFLPWVHQVGRHLAGAVEVPPWLEAGTVLEEVVMDEPGFYEIGAADGVRTVAVNVDRREADLARLDPEALRAASTRLADGEDRPVAAASLSVEQRERRQRAWWFLVAAALLLLAGESALSNRRGPPSVHGQAH